MVCYYDEVRKEAVGFIEEMMDEVFEAIENDDDYFVDGSVDDRFFECITDRAYTLTDAAFVINNSNNVEDDSGLWDGKDPQDALETQAAFTFANDVRSDVEELYESIKSNYDERYDDVYRELADKHDSDVNEDDDYDPDEDDYDPEDDARDAARKYAEECFYDEYDPKIKVVTDKLEKIRLVERYLSLKGDAGMWAGYPCGSSYIDSRCGVGFGMPEIYDYVEFDHMISRAIPDISGKNDEFIRKYLENLKKD